MEVNWLTEISKLMMAANLISVDFIKFVGIIIVVSISCILITGYFTRNVKNTILYALISVVSIASAFAYAAYEEDSRREAYCQKAKNLNNLISKTVLESYIRANDPIAMETLIGAYGDFKIFLKTCTKDKVSEEVQQEVQQQEVKVEEPTNTSVTESTDTEGGTL